MAKWKPKMYFTHDGTVYTFELHTDPPEAMYWSTHKFKSSEVKIFDSKNKQVFGSIKQELLDDLEKERLAFKASKRS